MVFGSLKHYPFVSNYRPDFEVVEERRGRFSYFPHTQQLPILLRALHMEFYGALPDRIARVDHRADGFDRIVLRACAEVYCEIFNSARADGLRLFPLMKPNLAATVAVVQQITESTPRGRVHRFRFYAGDDFFPEIYFIGHRVAFSEHLLERFTERVPNHVGTDLFIFLHLFYRNPGVIMKTGQGRRAVVQDYQKSILAFPFHENEGNELFFTTCLTVNEINSLEIEIPTIGFNAHYNLPYTRPPCRHWLPMKWAQENMDLWKRKAQLWPRRHPKTTQKRNWHYAPHWARDEVKKAGHGPGSLFGFLDEIPGPIAVEHTPDGDYHFHNEIEICKMGWPEHDWDKLLG